MKKNILTQLLSAMVVCTLSLSLLTGCSSKKEDAADAGVPNPMTEISPDELPIPMDTPDNSSDIQYFILKTDGEPIYQVSFNYNGSSYIYRA